VVEEINDLLQLNTADLQQRIDNLLGDWVNRSGLVEEEKLRVVISALICELTIITNVAKTQTQKLRQNILDSIFKLWSQDV